MSPVVSPHPQEDQQEAEAGQSPSRAQRESRGEAESQLGLRNHPAGGLRETLAGPEERNQPGPLDLVQEREGGVGSQDGGELEVDLDHQRDPQLGVEVDVKVVFLVVRAGRVGHQGVGGGVEAVREGDGQRW